MSELSAPPPALRTLPLELWAVIALLCVAGVMAGWPALQVVPDAITSLGEAGDFLPFAVLVLSLLVGLILVGAACLWLAMMLYWADPVARMLAGALSTSIALALLLDSANRSSETLVILACLAVVTALASPNVSRHFAQQDDPSGQPVPVVGARSIMVVLSAFLGFYGVVFLPITPLETRFAYLGAALIALSIVTYRISTRLGGGDPTARYVASMLMVGYGVVLLLVDRRHPAFLVPIGLGLAVIALLWVPRSSRNLFTPEGSSVPEPIIRWNGFVERVQSSVSTATSGAAKRTAPPERLPTFERASLRNGTRGTMRTQTVGPGAWRNTGQAVAGNLAMNLDARSWFPVPDSYETVRSQWSVSVSGQGSDTLAVDEDTSESSSTFRGRSSLVLTTARLMGVCADGELGADRLDPEHGPVQAWSIDLAGISGVTVYEPTTGIRTVAVAGVESMHPLLYVSGARRFADGAFQHDELTQLASDIQSAVDELSSHRAPVTDWNDA